MDIKGIVAIFSFMLVSTLNVFYFIKPETVNELIVGQWFMFGGVIVFTIIIIMLRALKEWIK
ncbi:hypothetical protein QU593_10325 [Rossellomorea marisflavi]|uniref:hypothetical protein n=1 Tax=Rossellomorea marisflavi TaxID=189381 RepID=UPI0025B081DB|nr:hypothetical protein [Rossellomorea marisflavi]WJV20801.1 hypothetical protein QU593_10325 [Rossellomorea marisflavi]